MMGFAWAFYDWGWQGAELRYVAVALTIACALTMVSRLRYTSFKGERKNERVPFWVMLLIVGFLGALMIDPPHVLFFAAASYALSGPVYWLWNKARRRETSA
jgi:CDP-diacylglycerol--serine O-phosphatidyltransferase